MGIHNVFRAKDEAMRNTTGGVELRRHDNVEDERHKDMGMVGKAGANG